MRGQQAVAAQGTCSQSACGALRDAWGTKVRWLSTSARLAASVSSVSKVVDGPQQHTGDGGMPLRLPSERTTCTFATYHILQQHRCCWCVRIVDRRAECMWTCDAKSFRCRPSGTHNGGQAHHSCCLALQQSPRSPLHATGTKLKELFCHQVWCFETAVPSAAKSSAKAPFTSLTFLTILSTCKDKASQCSGTPQYLSGRLLLRLGSRWQPAETV